MLDEDFPELVTFEAGEHRIHDNPPLIYHPKGVALADFSEAYANQNELDYRALVQAV